MAVQISSLCFVLISCVFFNHGPSRTEAVPLSNFYPYGNGHDDGTIITSNATTTLNLNSAINFYGQNYTSVTVNFNGVLMLGNSGAPSSNPQAFPLSSEAVIAPFWTEAEFDGATGTVHYGVHRSDAFLSDLQMDIDSIFLGTIYERSGSLTEAVVVTWSQLQNETARAETNTFQCVLAWGSSSSYILFQYGDGHMSWVGRQPALVGMNAGDGTSFFELPTSQTSDVLQVANTGNTGSSGNTANTRGQSKGRWIFILTGNQLVFPGAIIGFMATRQSVPESQPAHVCVNLSAGNFSIRSRFGIDFRDIDARVDDDYRTDGIQFEFNAMSELGDSKCSDILLIDDKNYENDETFEISLTSTTFSRPGVNIDWVAFLPQRATITILDNDSVFVTYGNVTVLEEDRTVKIPVRLLLADGTRDLCANGYQTEKPVQVMYATKDGTARAGVDYNSTNGTLTIRPRKCEENITVTLFNDRIFERNEYFLYTVWSNNPNITVNNSHSYARVTIQDMDGENVRIGFTQSSYTVSEGQKVNICVAMVAGNASHPISVTIKTDQSHRPLNRAIPGQDYEDLNTMFVFQPDAPIGQTMCLNLTTLVDSSYEGDETVRFFISSVSPVTLDPRKTLVNIIDTNNVTIAIANESLVYEEGGLTDRRLKVCANLTGEIERDLAIKVETHEGSAKFYNIHTDVGRRGDFIREVDDIVFSVSSGSPRRCDPSCVACTSVTIQDDHVMEPHNETFSLSFSTNDNAAVHFIDSRANVTIIDNSDVEVIVKTFSLDNVLLRENDNLTADICVMRKGETTLDITISIAARDLTATNHVDYEVRKETVTIYHDNTEACGTITVTLLDDAVVEGNETFAIFLESLTDPSRVLIDSRGERNVTIVDDDSVSVKFLQSSYNVSEEQGSVNVCLQMRGLSAIPLPVSLVPSSVSATGGVDFEATPFPVSLPPSPQNLLDEAYSLPVPSRLQLTPALSSPICANMPIVNDDIAENETYKIFSVQITNDISLVTVAEPQVASVIIEDDDNVIVEMVTSMNNTVMEGKEAKACVRLVGRAGFTVRAKLLPVGVSAQANMDFSAGGYDVSFPPMTTEQQCVLIPTLNDSVLESEETFQVDLSLIGDNPRIVLGQQRSVNISIIDDDIIEVGFDKMEYSVYENGSSVEVCVNMMGLLDTAVIVLFSTETDTSGSGQAAATQDYVPISNMPLFTTPSSAHSRRECVNITITNNEVLENTEHFNVRLSSPNATVQFSRRQSVVYILDEDGITISLESERGVAMNESNPSNGLEICVLLMGQTQKDIQFTLATEPGSATESSDYIPLDTTLTFLPSKLSQQRKCTTITVMDDNIFEEDENFTVTLETNTTAVGIHISRTVVTIRDDDRVSLSLMMSSKSVIEGEGNTYVCVNLTGTTERNISYSLHAQDIDAKNGIDYSASFPSPLFFPPSSDGSQSRCFHINITDDQVLENTEHFEIELFSGDFTERVDVNTGRITVTITDDDTVAVMFAETEILVDEDSPTHNGTICVVLQGEIDRVVSVRILSQPGTATAEDFVAVQKSLTFTPVEAGNQTKCFYVYAVADRLVEFREEFTVTMTTSDTGIYLTNNRAVVVITDNDVVCNATAMDTSRGYTTWPTTYPGEIATYKCENGVATRYCSADGIWSQPVIKDCYVSIEELFRYLEKTDVGEDSLRDLLYGLLQMLLMDIEPTLRHMKAVDSVLSMFAGRVRNGTVTVNTELFGLVLEVVDILTDWPPHILKDYSSNVVHSQEIIAAGLFEETNFTSYSKDLSRTAFYASKISPSELFPANKERILFAFGENRDGNVSVFEVGEKRNKESAIELPTSLRSNFEDSTDAKIFVSFYSTGRLFPVEQSKTEEGTVNVSAVVATSFAGKQFRDLNEDVLITINLGEGNYSNVTCVSWDFDAFDDQGAWVEDGCELIELDDNVAVCACNHLTNFACLVNIRDRLDPDAVINEKLEAGLRILSVMGICLSIVGLVLTVVTLVVFNKLRKKDNTVFRLQLCIAMILMLVTFVAGIDRVESFTFCVLTSCLIQYFTLTSFLWMAAEALLMFHKLVFVFSQVTTKFLAIVSAVCWLLPIPVVIIPVAIDRNYMISESYCFISNTGVFFGAFLGPIMAIILFNCIFFVVVVSIVLKHAFNSNKRMRDTTNAAKRKTICRTIFSSLGIMFLLGLTWVFGAFTISQASEVFQVLFVIFNTLQGFFIFLFFVMMAKETQDLWLQACGCKKRKRRVTLSSAIISSSSKSKVRRVTLDQNAERLKEMEEIDMERRKKSNTWDIAYVVPQNQFDIFMSSGAMGQKKKFQETKDSFKDSTRKSMDLQTQEDASLSRELEVAPIDLGDHEDQRVASPAGESIDSTQGNALECLSTADSGILMDNKVKNTTPSPTIPDHSHEVSGIGYVSAGSSLETLPQREEDCYVKDKESIDMSPHMKNRAIPNDYARLHIEKV